MSVTIGDVEREGAEITIQIASENLVAAIKAGPTPGLAQNQAVELALYAARIAVNGIRGDEPAPSPERWLA